MFDVEKLTAFAVAEITKFAAEHRAETFYGFAIDASLLCLNSVERFEESLAWHRARWEASNKPLDATALPEKELLRLQERLAENIEDAALDGPYGAPLTLEDLIREENEIRSADRKRGNPYLSKRGIEELRDNTGNWRYQGFVQMEAQHGFDDKAYGKHCEVSGLKQKFSTYGIAMDALLKGIKQSDVLLQLRRTKDFRICRVEHNY